MSGRKIILVLVVLGVMTLALAPLVVSAVSFWPIVPCGINKPTDSSPLLPSSYYQLCGTCDLFKLAKNLIDLVLFVVVPLGGTLLFVIAGFFILLGGANPGNYKKGKDIFSTTVYGILIILSAWLITNTIIKSLAKDTDVSSNWYKFECKEEILSGTTTPTPTPTHSTTPSPTVSPTRSITPSPSSILTPTPTPTSTPTPTPTGTLACMFNNVNYSNLNLCNSQSRPGGCGGATCSQYLPSIQRHARGAATVSVLKAFMVIESDCNIRASSATSYGLMQISPNTARPFARSCGVEPGVIDGSWLTNPANADASICLGAAIINSIAGGTCGSEPRNIYAGYNAGPGYCAASNDCQGENSCSSGPKRKWECPYDDPRHLVCNTGMYQTKQGATYINYCLNNPGF